MTSRAGVTSRAGEGESAARAVDEGVRAGKRIRGASEGRGDPRGERGSAERDGGVRRIALRVGKL